MKKTHPTIVRVKTKYQITIPPEVRKTLNIEEGDMLEMVQTDGSIVLSPKALVDKQLSGALTDVARGRVYGPFPSAKAVLRSLKK